jgi:hypothetical protein
VSRIAKEGRKYGVFLGLVTQRPAQLDPTLISQCSTVFAMRIANEDDQRIVHAAVSDPANRLLGFLSSLAPVKHWRSAPAFRLQRGCASSSCRTRISRPAKRSGADASMPARRSTAAWSRRWWSAGAALP